ncbi:MAG: alpha/beta hydrolase [Brevibacillus sp.]|nr:alpha/beta hydrolase [Brevibacillus sp.]
MATNPAILWLPGWGMADELWDPIRSRFPSCRHIIPDFSQVTRPDEFMAMIEKEIGRISHYSLIVVGWSMGGMLAQRLAARYTVIGLVLISTTGRFIRSREERSKGWPEAYLSRMQRGLAEDRERVMEAFYLSILTERERLEKKCSFHVMGQNEWTQEALMAGLSYLREEDCRPFSPAIFCPTTIIHGKDDTVCPVAAGEELAACIPEATCIQIEDCGHAPLIFHPEIIKLAVQRMVETYGETDCRETI